MSIMANVSLSLHCVAHGPPEPVRVIWLQDGAPLNSLSDPVALSPSTLNLTGIRVHPRMSRNLPTAYYYDVVLEELRCNFFYSFKAWLSLLLLLFLAALPGEGRLPGTVPAHPVGIRSVVVWLMGKDRAAGTRGTIGGRKIDVRRT